jgi:CRP-like cAMP-binding protein
MYKGAATFFPFLMESDPMFVISIVPFFRPCFMSQEDILYEENEYADEIYFLFRGRVGYVLGEQRICFKYVVPGSYFGEIEVLYRIPRIDTTMAYSPNVELYSIERHVVLDVLDKFPDMRSEMLQLANSRRQLNDIAKRKIYHVIRHNSQTHASAAKTSYTRHARKIQTSSLPYLLHHFYVETDELGLERAARTVPMWLLDSRLNIRDRLAEI